MVDLYYFFYRLRREFGVNQKNKIGLAKTVSWYYNE